MQGLRSSSGYFRRTSVVALAVFTHHWYWFALSYFLSLALKPTVLIGLSPRMVPPKGMQVGPGFALKAVSLKCLGMDPSVPSARSHSELHSGEVAPHQARAQSD